MANTNEDIKRKDNKYLKGILLIIGMFCVVAMLYLTTKSVIDRFELRTLDLRFQVLANEEDHSPQIVQLLLDDHSTFVAAQKKELNLGRIPWPRKVWGEVLEYLNRTKPAAVVFDINYLGPEGFSLDNIESDDYFTNAVKNASSKVFFAVLFTDSIQSLEANEIQNLEKEVEARINKIPKDIMTSLGLKKIEILDHLPPNHPMKTFFTYTIYTPIMHGLLKEGFGVGAINLKTDIDGVNRLHMPLFVYNNYYYPSLSLAVALSLLPEGQNKIELFKDKIKLGNRTIYIDEEGRNFTTWYGMPKTYQVFHVIDVIISERNIKEGKQPIINPDIFKDKIIIIGQTASGSDIHHTPMANVFVGTEIVATNIDNFLNQKKFIKKFNIFYEILLTFLFCGLVWVAVSKSKSIPATVLLSSAIIATYIFLTIFALSKFKIWIDLVGPVALLILTFVITYIIRYVFTHRQLESAIEQATRDGLTKLYNHRFFQERIHQDLANASRKDDRVSLCLIDIDFFKKFNDTYGHRAGDAVLIQVAQTLKDNVRKTDLVARYGGEEMCVLLDKTGIEEALSVAQKLVDAVEKRPFLINDGQQIVKVTISVGVSTYPIHAKTVQDLIEFADKGLYRAKENGRNQVGAMFDEIDMAPDVAGSPKQIKEVEISKAKLVKSLDDFLAICKEKEYNYKEYLYYMIRDKELLIELLKENEKNIKPEVVQSMQPEEPDQSGQALQQQKPKANKPEYQVPDKNQLGSEQSGTIKNVPKNPQNIQQSNKPQAPIRPAAGGSAPVKKPSPDSPSPSIPPRPPAKNREQIQGGSRPMPPRLTEQARPGGSRPTIIPPEQQNKKPSAPADQKDKRPEDDQDSKPKKE
ncbi:MAG: diguanylate cyclase [Cyanobacteriota bacterium]